MHGMVWRHTGWWGTPHAMRCLLVALTHLFAYMYILYQKQKGLGVRNCYNEIR